MNRSFKLFWTTHKWIGIILTLVFTLTAVTGFLLLVKKDFDWIMPIVPVCMLFLSFSGLWLWISPIIRRRRIRRHRDAGQGTADLR